MSDLVLVGTVHLDPEGRKSLYKTIERFSPGVLTIEISSFSVRYRLSNQDGWLHRLKDLTCRLPEERRSHAGLKLLNLQLRLPFEWDTAYRYSKIHNIPCLSIDSGDLARKELPLWKNRLLSMENLIKITDGPDFDLDDHFKNCYSQAKILLKDPYDSAKSLSCLSHLSDRSWIEREKTLENRIRRIHKNGLLNAGYSKIKTDHVHICGWMHLLTGYKWRTMADLLSDLTPVRVLLNRTKNGEPDHLMV
ncbi:MAG: hypothetical protein ACKVE3_05650 [Dissulfuribacterales bacterium]